jgi:hypothetical protein
MSLRTLENCSAACLDNVSLVLECRWASDNLFTGAIPDFIGNWKNLMDMYVCN